MFYASEPDARPSASAAATSSWRSRAADAGPRRRPTVARPGPRLSATAAARPGIRARPGQDQGGLEQGRPPADESPWLLVARHRGGSFEAAVARVRAAQPGDGLRRARAARRDGARAGGLGAAGAPPGAPAARVRDGRHPRAQHAARRDPLGGPEPRGRHRDRPGAGAPLRRPDREGRRPADRARRAGARLRGDRVAEPCLRRRAARARARSSTRCCATMRSCCSRPGSGSSATCPRSCRGCAATRPRSSA